MTISSEADSAIVDVVEGFCPLCTVELIRHGEMACCPCGGCSFAVSDHSLRIAVCDQHPSKPCEHWQGIWARIDEVHRTQADD